MLTEPVKPTLESIRRAVNRLSGGKIEQRVSEMDSVAVSGTESGLASVAADVATISNTLSVVSDLAEANSAANSSLQTDIATISDTLSAVSDLAAANSNATSLISNLAQANSTAIDSVATAVASVESTLSSVVVSTAASLVGHFDSAITSTAKVLSDATSIVQSGVDSVETIASDAHSLAVAIDSDDVFVDRGDPATVDFVVGDLITDGTWRDLNLSGIVPVGATAVLLGVEIKHTAALAIFNLRKNGNTNSASVFSIATQSANMNNNGDTTVACDSNRIIEYWATNSIFWVTIDVVVKGWWIGNTFVDRGDPASDDFSTGDFITDGTWRDLDLSGIVPVGATAVLLGVEIRDNLVNQRLFLRKNGNTNSANAFTVVTQVSDIITHGDAIVACDSNRVIEYWVENTSWTIINVVVKGWWVGGIFMDGGDPASNDFATGDFTTDGTWRSLDLSAIVPPGATAVALRFQITDDVAGIWFNLRKKGNTNDSNVTTLATQVANQRYAQDIIVACDYNRVIEYWGLNTTWSSVQMTVKGWWSEPATISHLHSTALSLVSHLDSAIASTETVLSNATSGVLASLQAYESALSDATSEVKASAYVDFQTNSNLISNLSNTLSAVSNLAETNSDVLSLVSNMASATSNTVSLISNIHADTEEPTGFVDRTATLSWNDGTYTLTITGTHDIYINGIRTTKGTDSIQIDNTITGLYWIYYNAAGTLTSNTVFPGWELPIMATVYWNATVGFVKGLAGEERHGIIMDWHTHQYLHDTVGSRYQSGLAGTFDDTTIIIGAGGWDDEDIQHAPAQQTTCNVLYKNIGPFWQWDAGVSVYYKLNGTALRYNNGNMLADCTPNRYMAMWIFATSDISVPIVALMGQRQDTTLANARANNTYESLSFGTLPFQEMKLLYRVILRSTGSPPSYVETQDYRVVSNLPAGTYVATDHGVLTGLGNDDHTQYALDSALVSTAKVLSDVTSTVKASALADFKANSNLISNISNTLSAVSDLAEANSVACSSLQTDIATISDTLSAVSNLAQSNVTAIASVESTLSSIIVSTAASIVAHFDSAIASTETVLSDATSDAYSLATEGYGTFVARGDPAANDYVVGDFTTDNTWYELDLGTDVGVPVGTKAVLIQVQVLDDVINRVIRFRQKGNVNEFAVARIRTQVANQSADFGLIVPCDVDRKIEYKATNAVWTTIIVTVVGWWI